MRFRVILILRKRLLRKMELEVDYEPGKPN